jgi:hypothetical protein
MSRLEVPEGTDIHAADAAAHSLGANSVTSIFEDEYRGAEIIARKLIAVETDARANQDEFNAALDKFSKKVEVRRSFLKGVEDITGVKVPVNVNATEDFVGALLEMLLLSDDDTKAKLTDHVKSFQKARQA